MDERDKEAGEVLQPFQADTVAAAAGCSGGWQGKGRLSAKAFTEGKGTQA
jgi:hypothetical protein